MEVLGRALCLSVCLSCWRCSGSVHLELTDAQPCHAVVILEDLSPSAKPPSSHSQPSDHRCFKLPTYVQVQLGRAAGNPPRVNAL